jgi:hypothetical protein
MLQHAKLVQPVAEQNSLDIVLTVIDVEEFELVEHPVYQLLIMR